MYERPPLFCITKANEEDVGVITAGDKTFTAVVATNFAIGMPIFIATRTSYANTQYVGRVVSRDTGAGTLTCEYGAAVSITSATLWRPYDRWQGEFPAKGPIRFVDELGKSLRMSQGGVLYNTATQAPKEYLEFRFPLGKTTDYAAWRIFVMTFIANGVSSFTAAWYDFKTAAVRMATVMLTLDRLEAEEVQPGLTSWTVEVAIQTENLYT